MRQSLLFLPFLILTLAVLSCTKSKSGGSHIDTDTASIVGTWIWAFQSKTLWDTTSLATLEPATTGVNRTLIFDSSGRFTFMHNDSIFVDTVHANSEPNYLQIAEPIRLLPNMTTETDTGFYQLSVGIVGCAIEDTTTLQLQNVTYQAWLSADTLLVHLDPCLTRIVDIYLRKH